MATTTEEPVDEVVEPSLREQIESARDEVIDSQVERGDVEAPQEGRARDASGRFTRGEKHDTEQTRIPDSGGAQPRAAPAKDPGSADPRATAPVSPPAEPVAQPTGVDAPQSWNAAEKSLWSTVPAAAQQAILRREQDFHRRITEDGEVRSVGNQFMTAANEHAQLIQSRGGNPVALFKEFLGILNQIHSSDPQSRAQLFRQLAAQNGVNLDQPAQPGASPPQRPQVPIQQLITQAVNQELTARQERDLRQREAQEMSAATQEIESFRSDPKHPHFAQVTDLMTALLQAGNAQTLEEAYELAVKAHPETSKILAAEAQAAAKAQEDAQRRAQAAKRKTGSLRPGPGTPPAAQNGSKGSIRDDLRAAMEEVRGRI